MAELGSEPITREFAEMVQRHGKYDFPRNVYIIEGAWITDEQVERAFQLGSGGAYPRQRPAREAGAQPGPEA